MQVRTAKRTGLAEQVIAQVRALIAEGEYRVGDRLPTEPELSEMFGVGRSTIREAMRVLSSRGLIVVRHGEGTYVAARTDHETLEERLGRAILRDIYEARLFLEIALSELAAQRRDASDVRAMRKSLKERTRAARVGDVHAYAEADFAFHLSVAKAAKSPALYDVYDSFVQTVKPALIAAVTPEYIRNEDDHLHSALCDAIADGKGAEARRMVRSHLHTSLKDIGQRLSSAFLQKTSRRPSTKK